MMKLGMIAPVSEVSFAHAAGLGLDFVEFCINGEDRGEQFRSCADQVSAWMDQYGVGIGSIGRWKSVIQLPDGSIDPSEIRIARELMQLAKRYNCPNYVCGCNYVPERSLEENYESALTFFRAVLDDAPDGVKVSVYNCRKMNFVNTDAAWRVVLSQLPALGIKFDPSHSRYAGSDYLQELLDWGDRIYHVHLKGSMIINGKRVDDPPAGLDQTDWKSMLNILRLKGYDRNLSIEPHSALGSGEMGERGLAYTVRYFREIML